MRGMSIGIAVLVSGLCACQSPGARDSGRGDSTVFSVPQRSAAELPGSLGRRLVRIEDVTAGQVLLSIVDDRGRTVVPLRSVREGHVVPVDLKGTRYYLHVVRLVNFLFGGDYAELELSTDPEPRTRERAIGEDRPVAV